MGYDKFVDPVVLKSSLIKNNLKNNCFTPDALLYHTRHFGKMSSSSPNSSPTSARTSGRTTAGTSSTPSTLNTAIVRSEESVNALIAAALAANNGLEPYLENRNMSLPPFDIQVHTEERLNQIAARLFSTVDELVLEATSQFRRILSIERVPPIDQVIATGVVPVLVSFLGPTFPTTLQYEAGWALTNIASGSHDQTLHVVNANALQRFIELLESPDSRVADQAVWAIGNIAGDNTAFRDTVLDEGAATVILRIFNNAPDLSTLDRLFVSNSIWTLSNLCRGKPRPQFAKVSPLIPLLHRVAFTYTNHHEVLVDTIWALSYLSDGPNENINAVIRN